MNKQIVISFFAGVLLAAAVIFLHSNYYEASAEKMPEETVTEPITTEIETETESQAQPEPESSTEEAALKPKEEPLIDPILVKLKNDVFKFEPGKIKQMLRDHTAAYPDTRGWIVIPDTGISFPIVQGTDNDFYLDHNSEGYYYALGSIFADYRNSEDIWSDFNTVIYGHNVWYGGMFHDIENFLVEDFFTSHNIYIFTLDCLYVYQPFSIFEADWGYKYFHVYLEEGDDWVSFAREMRDNSMFPQDVDFEPEDHILTVSTCTNGYYTQRWSFQSKRVAEVDYDYLRTIEPVRPRDSGDFYRGQQIN